VVALACDPSIQDTEAGGSQFKTSPHKSYGNPVSKQARCSVNTGCWGGERIAVSDLPGQKNRKKEFDVDYRHSLVADLGQE
jgi:hypothetical protein